MNFNRSKSGLRLSVLCLSLALGPIASSQTAEVVGDFKRIEIPMSHNTGYLQIDGMGG